MGICLPCAHYTTRTERAFYNFPGFFFWGNVVSLLRMEITSQVAEAFVSGVAIGSLVFAAMIFTVMLAQIIAQAVEFPE